MNRSDDVYIPWPGPVGMRSGWHARSFRRDGVLLALLAVAALLAALRATEASAQQVPRLDDRIVDQAGVLSADQRFQAQAAFDAAEREGLQLFALFVQTTGPTTATDFADAVAAQNGLGGNDALVVVAISDRRDAVWVGPLLDEITDEELDVLLAERVEPSLADGDYGNALVAAAEGLTEARGAGLSQQEREGGDDGNGSGGGAFGALLPILVVGGGAALLWRGFRRFRGRAAEPSAEPASEPLRDLEDLAREANSLLLETDDDLRQNEQELGFAEAQFGAAEAEPYRLVLSEARASLRDAFTLRQRLDDDEPESETEQRAMLDEIIARCERAQNVMAEQREHFQALRNLERDAPELLKRLPDDVNEAEQRLVEADRQLEQLESGAPSSAQAVAGNGPEARMRIAAARELIEAGRESLAQEDRSRAARSVRAAQEALAQATQLLDAVAHLVRQLSEARSNAVHLQADIASDIAAARGLLQAQPDAGLHARLEELDSRFAAPAHDDVIREHQRLQQLDSAANSLVAAATEGAERRGREEAALRLALRDAERRVDRTADYLASRRHGVGRIPRTRLREAERQLDHARELGNEDPAAALRAASRAGELADDAYESARNEFDDFDRRQGGGLSGGWGAGELIAGAVLGSILSGGGGLGGGGGGGSGRGRSAGGGFGGGLGGGRSRGGAW